ncbi:lipid-A-disaccharide synthase [Desulfovibrio sp. OttesenSCG-928-M14]|nr:lipid-A-disaccharide synthase [Desulfovibrio sp. OttesenSCG-928-M14]
MIKTEARPDTLWISAGELSGDLHGALLLKALQKQAPHWRYVGMGGLHMREAGLEALFRVEDLSVMGITEVFGKLPKILRLLGRIKAGLAEVRPKAIIVIDAPDFHFRVIKAARELDIPVYYYISPKIWAWREKRAFFIKENVRRLISILPFEQSFYQRFGMDIDYVGNPLVDSVNYPALAQIKPQNGLVGFLPGSREKEISSLLPQFGGAARILRARLPHLRFACMGAPGFAESKLRSFWPQDVAVEFISPETRFAFMRRCQMLIAASGTVTLESALAGVPTIITYKVSPLSFAVGRLLVKTPFIGLPNLVLGRQVFPELLQGACDAVPLADAALAWLLPRPGDDPLNRIGKDLDEIRALMGPPGAPERAADILLADLKTFAPQ